jgi:DNA-binding transcriptional LysR family regulator
MEVGWLEDFLALVETAHFSRAAERRSISQPAFSRRIKMLEAWLGVPLFNRDTHRIELTVAGEEWRPIAEDLVRRIYLGREQMREIALRDSSTLRFASTHALSLTFFPTWLESVEAEMDSGVSVSLVTDNMAGCELKMQRGQAQFLLCHHHPSASVSLGPNYFRSVNIGRDTLVPVCAAGPDGRSPLLALPGALDEPLPHLAYSEVSGFGRILAAHRALDGPSAWLTTVFTSHVAVVLSAMARTGRGIAWLPVSLVEPDLASGALVRAGGDEWDVAIDIRLYRPRERQSAVGEALWAAVTRMGVATAPEE